MKKGTVTFLIASIFIIGMAVLTLCIFWLPSQAIRAAENFPEFAYLKYPTLIGIYATVIPFYFALYQAFKLLSYIDQSNAFSTLAVEALRRIKWSAFVIIGIYILGMIVLMTQSALHPGIALIGIIIAFAALLVSLLAATLQELLKHAFNIKAENDLTV
ncbi:DUF2975 domain-containing protein [Tenuibacillus multivorans]|uniref:DUF2975 domain-containing protein n=1 Tax=Tenuibacillus multivorans TaxID=237069 RepID=A0A1G9ZKX4_9BACI|nr:DUF2975 domain-containing protein [Tenuibacillus multivorans]GEL77464.1 membrane protein [Tenuibacillus multivorans]SDN21735.1 Protein of unknown function [Tenuibacillus multivorans]